MGLIYQEGIGLACYANCNDRAAAHGSKSHGEWSESADSGKKLEIKLRADLQAGKGDGSYTSFVKQFIEHGATHVGGCCGCGPDHISALVGALTVDPKQ
jgi:S-methylmethionine-dependent homocysteine/selenocysteine methylase